MPERRENIRESRTLDLVTNIAQAAMVARRHADGPEMNRFSNHLHDIFAGRAWNKQAFEQLQIQLSTLVLHFGLSGNRGNMDEETFFAGMAGVRGFYGLTGRVLSAAEIAEDPTISVSKERIPQYRQTVVHLLGDYVNDSGAAEWKIITDSLGISEEDLS